MVKEFIPPVLIDFILRVSRTFLGFSGNYNDFTSALAKSTSYESDLIVETYKEHLSLNLNKNLQDPKIDIDQRSLRLVMGTLLAMHESALSRISILDFGGAAGIHYFHSLSTIRSSISRYVICESPAVSKNLSEISSPILFVSSLDHFRRDEFEVGIASGSLQCVKDPYESLEKLIHATQYLVLDRMPVVSEITQDEILVQKSFSKSGRRISYPVWFLSEEKFKQKISDFGGEILCSWEVPEDRPYFRKKRRPYFGYLVKCSN